MLWALIGIQSFENTKELSTRLALPYFYEELDIDAIPDLETWDHTRFSYVHSTLQDPSHQLRLVELLATDDDSSALRANLEVVGTIHEKIYEVVTYVWNPSRQPAMLRINGMPYGIPTGLAQVLKRLRGSNATRAKSFWIDAVSIDQQSSEEKIIMVGSMPEIFRFLHHMPSLPIRLLGKVTVRRLSLSNGLIRFRQAARDKLSRGGRI